jgi:hypothetical protein
LEYSGKAIRNRNRDANNRSVSFISPHLTSNKPLAIEVKLNEEKKTLKQLKSAKKRMLDSLIKKVVRDEEEKHEKEMRLLKLREEDERMIKENEEKMNRFHDQIARKRAQEKFEKEQKRLEEIRKKKEEKIKVQKGWNYNRIVLFSSS